MDHAARISRHISINAHVANWVVLGAGCVVHDFALVGRFPSTHHALARQPNVTRSLTIGERVDIGPHAIIYGGTVIGNDCLIGDAASIREGVIIGSRCVIGRHVTINYDVVLEDEVRIQDGTHITGGCKIGAGTFIGVGVVTSNDRRPEIVGYEFVGVEPPMIGRGCLIGSGACIIPGVQIGDGAVIGAGALVTKDVPAGGRVLGQPARLQFAAGQIAQQAALQSVEQYSQQSQSAFNDQCQGLGAQHAQNATKDQDIVARDMQEAFG